MENKRVAAEIVSYEQMAGLHDLFVMGLAHMRMSVGSAVALLACLLEECLRQSGDPHASFTRFLGIMQEIRLEKGFDPRRYIKELVDANSQVVVDYAINEITKGDSK